MGTLFSEHLKWTNSDILHRSGAAVWDLPNIPQSGEMQMMMCIEHCARMITQEDYVDNISASHDC